MAKGSPNDETMKLNFIAKVWDKVAEDYRPIYIAPDATDAVRGDVYLTDDIDAETDAATGVTAVSPKGVNNVKEELESQISSLSSSTNEKLPPIGTIYRSNKATPTPTTIWGGTWTRETDRHDFQGFYIYTRTA